MSLNRKEFKMSTNAITRIAISRPASLGDLYDIHTEAFKDTMIFKKHPIPESIVKSVECPRVDMQYLKTENFTEKFSKLKVSSDFTLSLLAGFVQLASGTGKYLQQEKVSARKAATTLMYSMDTFVDTLIINSEEMAEYICQKTIAETDATHIVIRVDWGANVFISFQDNSGNVESSSALSSKVQANFKNVDSSIQSRGQGSIVEKGEQLALRIYGDILPENGKIPQSIEEAKAFIQGVPALARKSNNGKGKPISYGLIPISVLRQKLGISKGASIMWQEIAEDVSQKMLHFFDNLLEMKQKMTDLCEDVFQYDYCLSEQNVKQVKSRHQELLAFESKSKVQLREVIGGFRNGKGNQSDFDKLLEDLGGTEDVGDHGSYSEKQSPITSFQKYLADNGEIVNHILWIKTLMSNEVLPIGWGDFKTIEAVIAGQPSGNETNKIFIFAFSTQNKGDEQLLLKNRNLFLQLLKYKKEKAKFFFINTDQPSVKNFPSTIERAENSSIHYYVNGSLKCCNKLKETEEKMKIPIVGKYQLTDNGKFGLYLTDIGIWGVQYYGLLASNCTLIVTEISGGYRIETQTTFRNISETVQLDKPLSDQTLLDGLPCTSTWTRKSNRLILEQTLDNKQKRVVIRKFLKDKLIVTLKLLPGKTGKDLIATRRFDRIE